MKNVKTLSGALSTKAKKWIVDLVKSLDNQRDNSYQVVARVTFDVFTGLTLASQLDEFHGKMKNSISDDAKKRIVDHLVANGYKDFSISYVSKVWNNLVAQANGQALLEARGKDDKRNGKKIKHDKFDCVAIARALDLSENGSVKKIHIVILDNSTESVKGDGVDDRKANKYYIRRKRDGQWQTEGPSDKKKTKAGTAPKVSIPTSVNECTTVAKLAAGIVEVKKQIDQRNVKLAALKKALAKAKRNGGKVKPVVELAEAA